MVWLLSIIPEEALLKKLLKMVQNKRKPESYYDDIMRKMDKDKDGDVTWNEFRDFNKKMASLLQPAFFLQRDLRKKIRSRLGAKFLLCLQAK